MNQYDFPIALSDVTSQGLEVPKKLAVIREDTREVLGLVSRKYSVIRHDHVINALRKAVDSSANETITVERNGALLIAQYDLPKMQQEVKKGDIVQTRLIVRNSYDGQTTLSFWLGAMRLVCTNGMVVGDKFASFSKKHRGEMNMDSLAGDIAAVTSTFDTSMVAMKAMANIEYTPILVDDWMTGTPFEKVFSEKTCKLIADEYNASGMHTLWGLYNACTAVITHQMEKTSEGNRLNLLRGTWRAMSQLQ